MRRVKSWIPGLETYAPGETREGFIKLASNENNYGPSPKTVKAIVENAAHMHKYPYKGEQLKKKIAAYCKVRPTNIKLGNGADDIIDMILKTFEGPTASFYPTYSEYRIFSNTLGFKHIEVPLEKEFGFNPEKFIESTKEANILFLCSPNNPTGTTIKKEELESVLDGGKITVVDEAYYEFYGKTFVPLVKKYENLIVLRTFAKAFALAGLRVGYAVACEGIIGLLRKVKQPFNVNAMAQEAALAALNDLGYMRKNVEKIREDRERMFRETRGHFNVTASKANFILMDVSPMTAEEFFEKMLEHKIIVRKFGAFKGFDGEYVRVTIGTTKECNRFLTALKSI